MQLPLQRNHAVVIGASLAGLVAARALADCFQQVTVLERERLPGSPQPRKGVPQGQQVHVLLLSGARAIETLFPGFFEELRALGSVSVDFSTDEALWFQHGVWKQCTLKPLPVHSQTRPFLEHHLRRRLLEVPQVKIVEQCRALRLAMNAEGTRALGVYVQSTADSASSTAESLLEADLVVDASGRNSATPEWLSTNGFTAPAETSVAVRIGYASRFYERSTEAAPPWRALAVYSHAPVSTKSGVIFRVEGDRWIVTLMGILADYPALDDAGFLEFARQLDDPAIYNWLRTATPVTPIVPYRYPSHLRRGYEHLLRFPEGLLVCGDAFCSFNPIYGQGMSVCALEALALKACLQNQAGERESLWQSYFKAAAAIVKDPWVLSTGADFLYPQVDGTRPWGSALRNWFLRRLLTATGRDRKVSTRFFEVLHLVRRPSSLFRPDLLARILYASR